MQRYLSPILALLLMGSVSLASPSKPLPLREVFTGDLGFLGKPKTALQRSCKLLLVDEEQHLAVYRWPSLNFVLERAWPNEAMALALAPNGTVLLGKIKNNEVQILNIETQEVVDRFGFGTESDKQEIRVLKVSPSGTKLVAMSYHGEFAIYDLQKKQILGIYDAGNFSSGAEFSLDESHIITTTRGGGIRSFTVGKPFNRGKQLSADAGHDKGVDEPLTARGNRMAFLREDHRVTAIDLGGKTPRVQAVLRFPRNFMITHALPIEDSTGLATVAADFDKSNDPATYAVSLWKKWGGTYREQELTTSHIPITAIGEIPSHRLLLIAKRDGTIEVWSPPLRKLVTTWDVLPQLSKGRDVEEANVHSFFEDKQKLYILLVDGSLFSLDLGRLKF